MKLIRITAETILAMFIVMFLVGVELAAPDPLLKDPTGAELVAQANQNNPDLFRSGPQPASTLTVSGDDGPFLTVTPTTVTIDWTAVHRASGRPYSEASAIAAALLKARDECTTPH